MPDTPNGARERPINEIVASFRDRMRTKENTQGQIARTTNESKITPATAVQDKTNEVQTAKSKGQEITSIQVVQPKAPLAAEPPPKPHQASPISATDLSKLPSFKRKIGTQDTKELQKRDKRRSIGDGSRSTALNQLSGLIEACIVTDPAGVEESYDTLRDHLHMLEHQNFTPHSIRGSTVLSSNGLKRCFASADHSFPSDIKSDAQILHKKWTQGDLNVDILRGVTYVKKPGVKGTERLTPRLDKEGDFISRTHNYYGNGAFLVQGMWWPIQLAALRDGAHGATVAGISGDSKKGAYSVIMSGSNYEDVDHGDEVGYTGTKSPDDEITSDTKCLKASLQTRNPVRLLRTSKLPQDNPYRPEKGIRYDGLYEVVDEECLDSKTHHWRFLLRRIPGQDEIRCKGKGKRPTQYDLNAWKKHREQLGVTG